MVQGFTRTINELALNPAMDIKLTIDSLTSNVAIVLNCNPKHMKYVKYHPVEAEEFRVEGAENLISLAYPRKLKQLIDSLEALGASNLSSALPSTLDDFDIVYDLPSEIENELKGEGIKTSASHKLVR
mmetsp:Transcript_33062/g.50711  ORF Transcript_33062/g.50711 Transcript_33062/m.50711 type:complete len:128 (-) Transcript_33062:2153-2536(-)